jgi:hypothetical protein
VGAFLFVLDKNIGDGRMAALQLRRRTHMKKSEMNDTQKANYEYLRSLGIKKSWAKRFVVEEDSDFSKEEMDKDTIEAAVYGFAYWGETSEGADFWLCVSDNAGEWLKTKSYHQALLEIPNNLAKKAE